ncbi:MAG: site-specific integrase [Clostridium sp.]|nr:site-specific integrase [Clostridium sp.]MCM1444771.1 site-specific integrase [Candidatus Amulumruptor caecigallinarius]
MSISKLDSKRWTKDGRKWNFHVRYKDLEGKTRQYQSKLFKTKLEAKEAERIFFLQLDKYRPDNDITFKELYSAFYEYQKDKVKITTLLTYKNRIKYISLLDNIKVKDFSLQHYELWRKKILEYNNISNKTRNYAYKLLKTIMNFGTKWYGLNFNNVYPKMSNFTNPNEIKKEMEFWTYEEFTQFVSVEKDLMFKCLWKILYFCGLRKGEARALTWKDIDFEEKLIKINKGISDHVNGKRYIITSPKTLASNRILPMPNELIEDLKKLKKQISQYKRFNINWFIFGGKHPIGDDIIRRRKNNNCILSNVKQIRIHDFRHSCASLLINNGADITMVAKFLGHSKIDETLNTYSHMFKDKLNNIITLINNLNENSKNNNNN